MILGASFDTPAANKRFADNEHFGYRLLSDVDKTTGRRYEVVAPDAPAHATPTRIAYLIDPEGTVRQAYRVSDVGAFAAKALGDLRGLQAG